MIKMMKCIIFDLDGTLVDSERLGNEAFLSLLPELDISLDALVERFRGVKLKTILTDLEVLTNRKLPHDFEKVYRERSAELFNARLKPMPGAVELLSTLVNPVCVASSGPMDKIQRSLKLTNLGRFFGEDVFSAYEVNSWKPDPGLFLHAAKKMGFSPADCIVIEDSEVGVQAAIAAGMTALHFCEDSRLESAQTFERLSQLPALINALDIK